MEGHPEFSSLVLRNSYAVPCSIYPVFIGITVPAELMKKVELCGHLTPERKELKKG
jgi:hypothetical protein